MPFSTKYYIARIAKAQILDDNNKAITLKWYHQFRSAAGLQTPDSIITVTTIMSGIPKNKLDKIWEEIECDNKEVHAGMDSAAFLLHVKNKVGSWYEQSKRTTNLVLIDMKMVLINSLDEDICKRIEIWATTTQTTLKFFHQLGAITGLWTRRTDHYGFYWHAQNSRERMKQRSGRIRHSLESKQGRSHVLGRAHNNDMRQIHGENLGHKI